MAPLPTSPAPGATKKRTPKTVVSFLSGATSGCISTIALQPLDVVKTRMQMSAAYNRSVRLQPALSLQPNASAVATLRGIVRQDRISGLWRGVAPSVLRNTLGVGVYFMVLNAITSQLSAPDGSLSDAATLYSGATARSFAVILLSPLSVVKTRMETVEYANKYTGVVNAIRTIAAQEGRAGLFSGLLPAIVRDAPFSAMYMLIYLRTKDFLGRAFGLENNRSSIVSASESTEAPTQSQSHPISGHALSTPVTHSSTPAAASMSNGVVNTPSSAGSHSPSEHAQPASTDPTTGDESTTTAGDVQSPRPQSPRPGLTRAVNFASGAFGGGLATLLTQPQDVIKTRMQLSQRLPDGIPSRYATVPEATRRVFAEEGVYGFFRGSSPRFIKRMLGSAITWMVFEEANAFYSDLWRQYKSDDAAR